MNSKPSLTILLATCLMGISFWVSGQQKKVQNVKGEWVISNDITPAKARENALNQAKVEALRKAGVPEKIFESTLQYRSDNLKVSKEKFESLVSNDMTGEILDFTITREQKRTNEFNNWMYEVWIDATVILHKNSKDPGFELDVEKLRENYSSPDKLTFEIQPRKDGYLTIFILSEGGSTQLYPNKLERSEKLTGQKVYNFPRSKALDYEVSTNLEFEINYLLLLYTKQEIPFTKEETSENVLRFIASIDPAEKCLKSFAISIKR